MTRCRTTVDLEFAKPLNINGPLFTSGTGQTMPNSTATIRNGADAAPLELADKPRTMHAATLLLFSSVCQAAFCAAHLTAMSGSHGASNRSWAGLQCRGLTSCGALQQNQLLPTC